METKYKTHRILEVALLILWISGCGDRLFNSGSAPQAENQSPSLPSELSLMDNLADKIFTGEPNVTSRLGQSIVLGKDINGDGYGDIIIGGPHYKEIQGRVYIYYGGENPTFNVPDITLTGEDIDNRFGHNVEMADFNNDNYADVAIGAPGYNSFQGRVYIYYGGPDFDATADKVFDGEAGTTGAFGKIAAGDINGDGCAELLVSAVWLNSRSGRVYLFYGAPDKNMDTVCDLTFDGEDPNDEFGKSLALGEDVDGDNYGEVVIGTREYENKDGLACLYYGAGGTSMDNICDLTFNHQSPGENFATDVDLFDIDNDGLADIIITARSYDQGRGRAYLYWGSDRAGADTTPDKYFTVEDDVPLLGSLDCGKINNDAYGDIILGGVTYPNNNKKGRAYLYYGNTKALIDVTCDMVFTGENNNDRFSVDTAVGDINGDNFAEVLIGARTFKSNSCQGRAYLYYGGLNKPKAIQGTKLLHKDARAGEIDQIKSLISKGTDVNAKDNKGHTSLWYPQDEGHTEIVGLLRRDGAKD